MTITEMKEVFAREISYLQELTAYENGLVPFASEEEAAETIRMWAQNMDEVPVAFLRKDGASILVLLWNTFITPDLETARRANRESYIENMKRERPDYLYFDRYYDDGETLMIDPDQLTDELRRLHYDGEHLRVIMDALRAYQKTYSDNL